MRTLHDLDYVIEIVSEACIQAEKEYMEASKGGTIHNKFIALYFVWYECENFLRYLESLERANESKIEFNDRDAFTWANVCNYWERTNWSEGSYRKG